MTALLGALVVVLEGVPQLYEWWTEWVLYRLTHDSLKHEQLLLLAGADPYSDQERRQVLAERVEGLVRRSTPSGSRGAAPGPHRVRCRT